RCAARIPASLPPVLRRILRRVPLVVCVLIVLAGVAYLVNEFALSDDESVAAAPLRVTVMPPGTFESAHPFAPYYVVPRKRFSDPSELSRVARNKIVSNPESALAKGALAGSPQIVRLSLRATSDEPVTVEGVRFNVVSDARPLRGWYTALSGCMAQPVRRAQADLGSKRAVRYVSVNGVVSRNLALDVGRSEPQVIELRAATKRRRVAWTAELSVKDSDGNRSTVVVDDGGEPFRGTATRASRGYEPVYGPTGITGFARSRNVARGGGSC
ncbi:MAG TPA: hypothetical protein VGV67_13210, partial [Solirubrobacteraceae bacterium]|nr:hypothetical protein [Solirubrobacteraceae bacterium]